MYPCTQGTTCRLHIWPLLCRRRPCTLGFLALFDGVSGRDDWHFQNLQQDRSFNEEIDYKCIVNSEFSLG
jgi:hypothetical protein